MKHLSRIEIVTPGVPGNRGDRVVLDGHDITRSVVAHQVSAQLGRITEVYLTLHVADASTHGAAAVFMDPSTAALLQRHGWTPPEGDELLLTAHECELEQLRAEVEHLKVERGEALAWSPWNDHDVLFEQWAKRRAAVDEPAPHQRASGGPVPAGQTVTIGPDEPPPLPKRVKGTHGPTPTATTCSSCNQPTLPNGRCYNRDRCPQSAATP